MAFKFSLATVLRVRAIVETREEGILQKILFDIAKVFDDLERTDAQLGQAEASRHADALKPSIGLQIQAAYGEMKELKQRRKDLEGQIEQLEKARDMQLVVYEAAHRDHEMLSEMREKKKAAYESEINKREQSVLDDNYIARRGRV